MKKEGNAIFVLRIVRTILLADVVLAILVGLACFILDLRTPEAYGTVLVWAGAAVIFLACLAGIGGFSSRSEDARAFSLSGAGNMSENLQRISDARSSNLGCFIHLAFIGIGLIALGYLIQIVPFLF